ncbi:hypothetical protein VB773_01495 [Haloarculaceae archaeon H-GB2-1]|nr:hypothetical protein [Haloarculaceae archaeon H-GB2-1]
MSGSESRRILDLFSGLGGFSAAFEDSSNWEVTTVEIEEQFDPDICADILDLRPSDFDHEYDVILASPRVHSSLVSGITTTGTTNRRNRPQMNRVMRSLSYCTRLA